jgi:hypothetical protein
MVEMVEMAVTMEVMVEETLEAMAEGTGNCHRSAVALASTDDSVGCRKRLQLLIFWWLSLCCYRVSQRSIVVHEAERAPSRAFLIL